MVLLVAILLVAALLAGFLFLTSVEEKRGRRVFERSRVRLDAQVEEAVAYLASSGERGTSLSRTVRTVVDHIVHDVIHGVLVAVRFAERTLTRTAREIRGRRAAQNGDTTPPVQ